MGAECLVERTNAGLHASLMAHVTSLPRNTAVLDIGCGTGAWLERLAQSGFTDLHGIDGNAGQFACRRASFEQVDLDRGGSEFHGREFGLITAIEVIEHLENPGNLWSLVSRNLAQDGRFLLTTPNIQSMNARLRFLLSGALPAFDRKGDPTHVQPMYLEGAIRVMKRHRLEIDDIWAFPARGSMVFRKSITGVAKVLSVLIADDVPGDNICLSIRRCAA